MKKTVIAVIVSLVLAMPAMSQVTLQAKKQMKVLETEISSLEKEISQLEKKIPPIYYPDEIKRVKDFLVVLKTALKDTTLFEQEIAGVKHQIHRQEKLLRGYIKDNAKTQPTLLKAQIKEKEGRLVFLQGKRDSILDVYATSPGYLELTCLSKKRRTNALTVKRGELALNKMAKAPIKADPVTGYEGVIKNLSQYTKCSFVIKGTNSWDEAVTFFLGAGEQQSYNLLPGEYICTVYARGVVIGTHSFTVSPQMHKILGEDVHWAVYREGY